MKVLSVLLGALLFWGTAQAETLRVYTYESFVSEWGPGPEIEKRFEARCGCDLEFVGLQDGVALLNRLKLEGAQSDADVILGIDDALVAEAEKLGLFAPHGLDLSGLNLPVTWTDSYFVPYDYGYFAFIYNADKLPEPPKSLKALVADPQLKVIYQDPRTSTPGQGLMLWINTVYGDAAEQAWKQLATHTVTITPGWSEAYNLFLEGQGDMVLSYTTSPAYHMTYDKTDKYRAAVFGEGHYTQIEVLGRLAHARHPELANDFLKFMISPAAQDVLAGTNWMYPVREDAKRPEAFDRLPKVKPLHLAPAEVAAHRKDWVATWRAAVSR